MIETVVRIACLCVALAGVETLHGVARTVLLAPRIGKQRALKVSILTGSALAFFLCYLLVPPMRISETSKLIGLGIVLALFMAAFDVTMAKVLLRRPWRKVIEDFNPKTGNYLLYGLMLLSTFPYVVMRL